MRRKLETEKEKYLNRYTSYQYSHEQDRILQTRSSFCVRACGWDRGYGQGKSVKKYDKSEKSEKV